MSNLPNKPNADFPWPASSSNTDPNKENLVKCRFVKRSDGFWYVFPMLPGHYQKHKNGTWGYTGYKVNPAYIPEIEDQREELIAANILNKMKN